MFIFLTICFFLRCLHIIRTILSGWTKSGGEKCGWTKIRTMKKSGHWQNLGGKNTNKIKNLNNTKITKFQAECAGKLISGCFTRTFVNVSKSGEREKNKSGKPKSKSGKNSSIVRILALYWFFFHCPDFSLFVFFPLDFVHPDFVTPDCVVELLFVLFFDFVFC